MGRSGQRARGSGWAFACAGQGAGARQQRASPGPMHVCLAAPSLPASLEKRGEQATAKAAVQHLSPVTHSWLPHSRRIGIMRPFNLSSSSFMGAPLPVMMR